MWHELWSGTVGGRPVVVKLNQEQDVVISTVLAKDEGGTPGGLVAPLRKGDAIDLEPDEGETYEQVLSEAGFTPEQAAEIIRHIPTVLSAR